jgi:hypothetical protein
MSLTGPVNALGPLDLMDRYTGTRAMSMGGAFTAVADDVSAPYWNPAGLTYAHGLQLGTSYMSLFGLGDRLTLDGLYRSKETGFTLAGNFVQEGISNIPRTEDVGGGGITTGTFDEYKRAFNGAVAHELRPGLSLGANIRFLYNTLDEDIAAGGSLDAGLLYRIDPSWSAGLMGRNIFSRLDWTTSEKEYLDRTLTGGLAWKNKIGDIPALFTLDLEAHQYFGTRWYAGAEFWLVPELFAFRLGTNSLPRWTFGFGLQYFGFVCDVCYFDQELLGEQYLLSLGYRFGEERSVARTSPEEPAVHPTVEPLSSELSQDEPLKLSVPDKEHIYQRASVVFPGKIIKKMVRTKEGFSLTYKFPEAPPPGQPQEAKVFIQDKNGDIQTEVVRYVFLEMKADPAIASPNDHTRP